MEHAPPAKPKPRAWTLWRILLLVLGVACIVGGLACLAYGMLFFVLVFTMPLAFVLWAAGLGLIFVGLLLVASPWVHYWLALRRYRRSARLPGAAA